jgi:ABC-type antimicrobial peptide transport system permease subunit
MNVMLMSVSERTQEIGVRRAVGARRVHILQQFLLEALIISIAGGLAGILAGLALPELLQPLWGGKFAIEFSWLSPALAMLVSCLFGLGFGLMPAKKAASLQPAESLRCE